MLIYFCCVRVMAGMRRGKYATGCMRRGTRWVCDKVGSDEVGSDEVGSGEVGMRRGTRWVCDVGRGW